MKRTILRIFAPLACLGVLLAGCGGPGEEESSSQASAPVGEASSQQDAEPLTAEEYIAAVGEELSVLTGQLQPRLSQVGEMTEEELQAFAGEIQAGFQRIADLVPPETMEAAHELIRAGCENMVEYYETVAQLLADPEALAQREEELSALLEEANSLIAQGAQELSRLAAEHLGL